VRQLTLIDSPPLAPALPPSGLVRACLDMLLSGRAIDHLDFQAVTASWRLAAYIDTLRRLGWPIEALTENAGDHRNVARYRLDPELLAELRAAIGFGGLQ
jgi:hypothetical protein